MVDDIDDIIFDTEDCEHGLPAWDQCDACLALYEDYDSEMGCR